MNLAKRALTKRFGVDVHTAERMMQAGMTAAGDLAQLSDQELRELTGLENVKALRKRTVFEKPPEVQLNDS